MKKWGLIPCVLVVLRALVGGGGAGHAEAQGQTKLAVTARAGYGDSGSYLIGEWVPVRVTLSNPAGADSLRVLVQVQSKGSDDSVTAGLYAKAVDLPSPSRKEVTLYAFSGGYTRRFRVQVFNNSVSVATVDVDAEPLEPPANTIVAIASSDPSLLNAMKGEPVGHIVNSLPPGGYSSYGGPYGSPYSPYGQTYGTGANATVAHITLDDIPTLSQALDDLGAIIFDDVDTGSLSEEQLAALEAWVSRGGMVVVTARPGGADATVGLGGMSPVNVAGSRNVTSLRSLEDLVGVHGPVSGGVPAIGVTGPVSVGEATVKPEAAASSRALAVQDGVPLVVERDLGLGHVVYMGLSPGLAPLKSWDGTIPLVKRVLADRALRFSYGGFLRFSPSRGYYMGSLYDTYGGMFALPGLELPSPLLIGFFLLVYIIIIGPVNFIVLRRMRRTELAWVTMPALVLLFSVGAYLIAFQSKGGDLVAIRANVIGTYPDVEQATSIQHFGLFSPVRRTYNLSLPADSVITEMNSYGYYQAGSDGAAAVVGGNPTTINNVNINTWSLKGFVAEHTDKAESPVETNLSLGDNVIAGTLRNRTNTPLQDVALVRGDAVRYIGYLAPGQQIDVRLSVSANRFNNASPGSLIPPPSGVFAPQPGFSYPYSGGQGNSAEQRTYNRKIELLSAALYPLVADMPPIDLNVVVLAWGPSAPAAFGVDGYSTSSEELNVWASLAPVGVSANEAPALNSGLVPYSIYAPGNSPPLVPWNGSNALPNAPGGPGAVPTFPPTVAPTSVPSFGTPTPAGGGTSAPLPGIHVSPYADIQFRLPPGTKPDKLTFDYSIARISTDGDIDLMAYNVTKGSWDVVGTWADSSGGRVTSTSGSLSIPNPVQYTGPGGEVTLRIQPRGTDTTLTDAMFSLGLNGK
jgi:hypothetical protein